MYYYYECIRMLRKDLDCVRKIGRDAEKPRYRSTNERTHNIYDCECVSTKCEAEDRNTRAYLTC